MQKDSRLKLGIYANLQKPTVPVIVHELIKWLEENDIDYVVDNALLANIPSKNRKRRGKSPEQVAKNCDFLVTFGGDGTMLAAAHLVGSAGTPILH